MQVACKTCQSLFRLDSKLIKPEGSFVRCTKCESVFQVYPPDLADRRKFPRAKTRNLIAHITVGRDGQVLSQGMGKALDISKGGMLLETLFPVEKGTLSLMAVDKDLSLFEMKAELVYCKKTSSGRYHSGIEFSDTDSQVIESITKLIKAYNHRKKTVSISVQY
jgi:predicted Zn finger-like uncharacterized protein